MSSTQSTTDSGWAPTIGTHIKLCSNMYPHPHHHHSSDCNKKPNLLIRAPDSETAATVSKSLFHFFMHCADYRFGLLVVELRCCWKMGRNLHFFFLRFDNHFTYHFHSIGCTTRDGPASCTMHHCVVLSTVCTAFRGPNPIESDRKMLFI